MNKKWIRRRMRQLGLTQNLLAQKLGLSPPALSRKLNGYRRITLSECAILATWLQLTPQEVCDQLLFAQKPLKATAEASPAEKPAKEGRGVHAA